jgi:colicin import membrane protein
MSNSYDYDRAWAEKYNEVNQMHENEKAQQGVINSYEKNPNYGYNHEKTNEARAKLESMQQQRYDKEKELVEMAGRRPSIGGEQHEREKDTALKQQEAEKQKKNEEMSKQQEQPGKFQNLANQTKENLQQNRHETGKFTNLSNTTKENLQHNNDQLNSNRKGPDQFSNKQHNNQKQGKEQTQKKSNEERIAEKNKQMEKEKIMERRRAIESGRGGR